MIREAIRKIVEKENLTRPEAEAVMNEIMNGEATPAQIGSFITALRMKGETVEELTAFVSIMRQKSVKVPTTRTCVVDTCGTGGDRLNTFNISTAAAFVVAGAGVPVAKHGNRAASSNCGSADVLEALGIHLTLTPEQVGESIDSVNIGFMFAPSMHPAMKHAVGPRKDIGVRTVFNILGPMTNPAGAKTQLIGVFSPEFCEPMANVLKNLGTERAMVVHGLDGLDEVSTIGRTRISELRDGAVRNYEFEPEEVDCPRTSRESISGGVSVEDNAQMLTRLLEGEKGPRRDIVCLNAGVVLALAGAASDLKQGFILAERTIDSGSALEALNGLRVHTQRCVRK